ncbi:putative adhesin [Enterobacter roggenkampii]|uniref:putative adhesin n=1 Tax=Enterobacter roggenkampii TaxID=1812935 RepID=UPI002DB96030|nr:hypothetical protein [Enterobacter roggenkampii]MEB5890009.1 hypothetical protein [Enterobacter roggenkampii]
MYRINRFRRQKESHNEHLSDVERAGIENVSGFNSLPGSIHEKRLYTGMFNYKVSNLGERYKIISEAEGKAEQLIITAHGSFTPRSKEITVPDNVTLKFLNPHGTLLTDPGVSNIASGEHKTFVSVSNKKITPEKNAAHSLYESGDLLALTGSNKPGMVRDYAFSKYREDDMDTIVKAISSNKFYRDLGFPGAIHSDILVVRNRKNFNNLFSAPSLGDILNELQEKNIHYDTIVVGACRGPLFGSADSYDSTLP